MIYMRILKGHLKPLIVGISGQLKNKLPTQESSYSNKLKLKKQHPLNNLFIGSKPDSSPMHPHSSPNGRSGGRPNPKVATRLSGETSLVQEGKEE